MFTENQEVKWSFLGALVPCRITAQRHYTEAYDHWDLEVLEEAHVGDQKVAFAGWKVLGIPESEIQAEGHKYGVGRLAP